MKNAARGAEVMTTIGLALYAGATPFSIAICQGGLILAALSWFVRVILMRRWPLRRTPLELPLLAYAATESIATIFSLDPAQALFISRRLLLIPMIYLVADHLRTSTRIWRVLTPLFGVGSLLSLITVIRYLSGPGGLEERIRFTQIYMTTAGILMITICLVWGLLLWGERGRYRWWLAGAGLIMSVCLLFTYTRSAWLGLIGGMVFLLPLDRFRWRRHWWVVPLLIIGLAGVWTVAPESLRDRALSSFEPSHFRNVERVHMWKTGLRIWADYPWTGVGDIGTAEVYREYMPSEAKEVAGHFHSNPVHLLVTLGSVGLIAWVWLFVTIFRLEWDLARRPRGHRGLSLGLARGALAALVAFQIEGLFEWNFGDAEVVMLIWFSVGLALAGKRLEKSPSVGCTEPD